MIALIDYGMGNLNSVKRKLDKLGFKTEITSNHMVLCKASKIILPGVGHFGKAMTELKKRDLISPLNELVIGQKVPVLGICLGMQLMTTGSDEGSCEGLNWFSCKTERLKPTDMTRFKVPHIGWNTIDFQHENTLLTTIPKGSEMYFVHSYAVLNALEDEILTSTSYETSFISGLKKDHLFGVQFHPEKSHELGKQMLYNFASM